MKEYSNLSLNEFKNLSEENRNDLKSVVFRQEAVKSGEKIALGKFSPTISLSASVDQAAPVETYKVRWDDYIRSKSVTLSVSWPLFEGGRKLLDYQLAKIQTEQMNIIAEQTKYAVGLDVEQSYYNYTEAVKSLQSLKDAADQYGESLRISNLLYAQGMSSQLDVLNAQLLYTKSKSDYLRGIYYYNVGQLALLKSIGLLDKVWK